jgi:malate dehydrogenase (oxaloacetate-decarboxylating)
MLKGAIYVGREAANGQELDAVTDHTARTTNPRGVHGSLQNALAGADVFIGFGGRTILTRD